MVDFRVEVMRQIATCATLPAHPDCQWSHAGLCRLFAARYPEYGNIYLHVTEALVYLVQAGKVREFWDDNGQCNRYVAK